MNPITGLYLIPDARWPNMLEPDACGGRPPVVSRATTIRTWEHEIKTHEGEWLAGEPSHELAQAVILVTGCNSVVAWERALALIHNGVHLALGLARAQEHLPSYPGLDVDAETMARYLGDGWQQDYWRVVVVRSGE